MSKTLSMSVIGLLLLCVAAIATARSAAPRTMRLVNKCDGPLYVAGQGIPVPWGGKGGMRLEVGQTYDLRVPGNWVSGRIWARTLCEHVTKRGITKLKCATGNCPLPDKMYGQDNDGTYCTNIGGLSPMTLAEFTFAPSHDWYDISLVDGFNLPLSIKPIGNFKKLADPNVPAKFNCGAPVVGTFDHKKCPPELQLQKNNVTVGCLSVCAAVHNMRQVQKHPILATYDKDLVCCQCGLGIEACGDKGCRYGCSPLDEAPERAHMRCFVEEWPRATTGQRYDEVFKSQMPDAYSWQFDDNASTYQCGGESDYELVFCEASTQAVKEGEAPTETDVSQSEVTDSKEAEGKASEADGQEDEVAEEIVVADAAEVEGEAEAIDEQVDGEADYASAGGADEELTDDIVDSLTNTNTHLA